MDWLTNLLSSLMGTSAQAAPAMSDINYLPRGGSTGLPDVSISPSQEIGPPQSAQPYGPYQSEAPPGLGQSLEPTTQPNPATALTGAAGAKQPTGATSSLASALRTLQAPKPPAVVEPKTPPPYHVAPIQGGDLLKYLTGLRAISTPRTQPTTLGQSIWSR